MGSIDILAGETKTTRVFSVSMSGPDARKLRIDPQAQRALLRNDSLNQDGIELFPLTDLGDLGLAGYLRDGIDAQESDLKRDAAKLAALDGWVMMLHSSAFDGKAALLEPSPALTLIGTYAQTPAQTAPIELKAETAKPYSSDPASQPNRPKNTRATGSLVIVVLVGIAAKILWWALS